jgi:hypothetical protein
VTIPIVRVPIHTVSESNSRDHWRKRAARAKEQRFAVDACLRTTLGPNHGPVLMECFVELEVLLTRVSPRELDDDNLRGALKAARDSVAQYLGLKSDRDKRVSWAYAQERGAKREYAVEIRMERRK